MLAKRLSCFVMILLLFLPTLGLASARNIVVRTEYHSTDTVDERNTYLITIDNKGDIEFKVEALNGSFELYFCDGHTTNSSSYRSRHSADEPVTSFSSALSVGKDDDKMYTINVYNASGRPVDYTISITTYRGDEWVNIFLACGFLILLIVGGIPMLIWWRKQKREFYAVNGN